MLELTTLVFHLRIHFIVMKLTYLCLGNVHAESGELLGGDQQQRVVGMSDKK